MQPRDMVTGAAGSSIGVRCGLRMRIGLAMLLDEEFRLVRVPGESESRHALPSVRALAAAAAVHRNTAAAVYRDLEFFGLVRRVQGSGTFPRRRPVLRAAIAGRCRDAGLASVACAELGVSVFKVGEPPAPPLVPLDEVPPGASGAVPLAPSGGCLRALAELRPGSNVALLSSSARVGLLVRNTLLALHGTGVGLQRLDPAGDALARHAGFDLWLADAIAYGTADLPVPRRQVQRLTLVPGCAPRCG